MGDDTLTRVSLALLEAAICHFYHSYTVAYQEQWEGNIILPKVNYVPYTKFI